MLFITDEQVEAVKNILIKSVKPTPEDWREYIDTALDDFIVEYSRNNPHTFLSRTEAWDRMCLFLRALEPSFRH